MQGGLVSVVTIEVKACGDWAVTLNGAVTKPLHSRFARELLVRLSLASGRLSRDQLVAELRPDESNGRAGRRRLSQELSRAQNLVGATIWAATRDHVGIDPECCLQSDASSFHEAAGHGAILANEDHELDRLIEALQLVAGGDLLMGHVGEWVENEREALRRTESRLLTRAIALARPRNAELALQWAQRKVQLDPFDEQAHASAVRMIRAVHGTEAAKSYVAELQDLFVQEIGSPPTAVVQAALDEASPEPSHPILMRVADLAAKKRQLRDQDRPEQVGLLFEIDDLLREAGHQDRRLAVLDELAAANADPTNLAWRQAEVFVAAAMPTEAVELLDKVQALEGSSNEADALLATVGAVTEGSSNSALASLESVLEARPPTRALLEAKLALAFIHDQRHDGASAEQLLLQVWDTAEVEQLPYYRAAALSQLGWARTRAGDHLEAQSYLSAAIDLSTECGADGITADAKGALAYRLYQENLLGSAQRAIEEAASQCEQLGRFAAEMRWRNAGCVVAHAIGDVPSIQRHHDRLKAIVARSPQTAFQFEYTVADTKAILAEYHNDHRAALAIHQDLYRRATAEGAHLVAFVSRLEVAQLQLGLKDDVGGLETATALIAYIKHNELPPGLITSAKVIYGVALITNRRPEEGIDYLRRVSASNQIGMPMRAWYLRAYHQAALQLGIDDEARAVLMKAGHYIAELRKDLTPSQWETALECKPDLRDLVAMLPQRC